MRFRSVSVAVLITQMLLFSVKLVAQSSVKEEVSEAVTLVRIGHSPNERTIAAMLLSQITNGEASDRVDDESLRSIIALLDINDDSVRGWVALCLGNNFGPRAKAAVPKLLMILDHADWKASHTSVPEIRVALKKIGAVVPPSKCD